MLAKLSGIYRIENLVTGRVYIGRSSHIQNRWSAHRTQLAKGIHPNEIMQADALTHGCESFSYSVIELAPPETLMALEQNYLDSLAPSYNISKHSLAPMAGRTHSEQTKAKISAAHRANPNVGKWNIGRRRTHTEQTKAKISAAHFSNPHRGTWNIGRKHSASAKAKMVASRSGNNCSGDTRAKLRAAAITGNNRRYLDASIEQSQKKVSDNFGNIFDSLVRAAKHWGISVATVCDFLKGRSKTNRKGVIFKYVDA